MRNLMVNLGTASSTALRGALSILFFTVHYSLFIVHLPAQDRSRLAVYVPEPTGGTEEQREFFQNYFKMELIGANYPSVETEEESRYILDLDILDNEDFAPNLPEESGNDRYRLSIVLLRTADDSEVVSFAFPFSNLNTMSNWTLFLLYNALANAYVPDDTPSGVPPETEKVFVEVPVAVPGVIDDRWRNKWLYLNFSVGPDMAYLLRAGSMLTDQGVIMPWGYVGLEFHFLYMMSFELDGRMRFLHDAVEYYMTICPAGTLRWVFKPGDHAMVEAYAGMEYALALTEEADALLSVTGGLQVGLRGGQRGAVVFDVSVSHSIVGQTHLANNTRNYGVMRVSLAAGYKLGFKDRPKK